MQEIVAPFLAPFLAPDDCVSGSSTLWLNTPTTRSPSPKLAFTKSGERIFSVLINVKPVLENLDIISKTQEKERLLVHKLTDVKVGDKLEITRTHTTKIKSPN